MPEKVESAALGPVARSVKILRFLADKGATSIQDASKALGLAPSTVHRLFDLLMTEGIIERESFSKSYKIGPEFYRVSAQVVARYDSREVIIPVLREVAKASGETCVFGRYLEVQKKMAFLEREDADRLLRYHLPMNEPLSVLWGASGLAILAFLPDETVRDILAHEGAAPGSDQHPPTFEELQEALRTIRKSGFAVSVGQKILGAVGVAAPVFNSFHTVIGSLCITAPYDNVDKSQYNSLGELVKISADKVSHNLGCPPS